MSMAAMRYRQQNKKYKAAEHCRTPKPGGVSKPLIAPTGFGVRQCSAAFGWISCAQMICVLLVSSGCVRTPRARYSPDQIVGHVAQVFDVRDVPGKKSDGSVLLPNQWSLRPAGKQI